MNKILLTEDFFEDLAKNYSVVWNVLKGRFWQMVRSWIDIYRIWGAESYEEIFGKPTRDKDGKIIGWEKEGILQEHDKAIEQIKGKYRNFEDTYAEQNGLFNSTYGNNLLFFHPAFAVMKAIADPILNVKTRQDLFEFFQDENVGLTHLPGIGPYLQNPYTTTMFLRSDSGLIEDGEETEAGDMSRVATRPGYVSPATRLIQSISSLFEAADPTIKMVEKERTNRLKSEIVRGMQGEGLFEGFDKIAERILVQQSNTFAEIVNPAAQIIKVISELYNAKSTEIFVIKMKELTLMSPFLKNLNPDLFIEELDKSILSIRNNEKVMSELIKVYKKSDITDEEIKDIAFKSLKNEFLKRTIEIVEDYYEGYRKFVMGNNTEQGLKVMEKTKLGLEYSNLIKNYIKKLDSALQLLVSLRQSND